MDPSKANEWARAERCVRITSAIDAPFLEKPVTGDVLVTCSVLSKLHCGDLCIRNPYCIGFNYKKHNCEILRDIHNAYDKGMSQSTGAFMKNGSVSLPIITRIRHAIRNGRGRDVS